MSLKLRRNHDSGYSLTRLVTRPGLRDISLQQYGVSLFFVLNLAGNPAESTTHLGDIWWSLFLLLLHSYFFILLLHFLLYILSFHDS